MFVRLQQFVLWVIKCFIDLFLTGEIWSDIFFTFIGMHWCLFCSKADAVQQYDPIPTSWYWYVWAYECMSFYISWLQYIHVSANSIEKPLTDKTTRCYCLSLLNPDNKIQNKWRYFIKLMQKSWISKIAKFNWCVPQYEWCSKISNGRRISFISQYLLSYCTTLNYSFLSVKGSTSHTPVLR